MTDTRWTLTETERVWCVELRAAIQTEGLDNDFTDFEIAQFALVGKGKTDKALARVKKYLAVIRDKWGYKTHDAASSPHLGVWNRKAELCQMGAPKQGSPVQVYNYPIFYPGDYSKEELEHCIAGMVIDFDAACCNLDRIRNGITMVALLSGLGWANYSAKFEKESAEVYQDAYPCRYNMMPMVDGGWIMTAMLKLAKLFLKEKMRKKLLQCTHDELYTKHGFVKEDMPPMAGGTHKEDYVEWIKASLAERAESMRKVKIDEVDEVEKLAAKVVAL